MKHYGLYSLSFLLLFSSPLRAQAPEASTEQTPIAFLKRLWESVLWTLLRPERVRAKQIGLKKPMSKDRNVS